MFPVLAKGFSGQVQGELDRNIVTFCTWLLFELILNELDHFFIKLIAISRLIANAERKLRVDQAQNEPCSWEQRRELNCIQLLR